MRGIICVAVLMALAALWRYVDGQADDRPLYVRAWVRHVTAALLLAAAVYVGPGLTWQGAWAAGFAYLNIQMGHTSWSDPVWMSVRYGALAALAAFPLGPGFTAWLYVGLCAGAGLVYAGLMELDALMCRLLKVDDVDWGRRFGFDGPEAWARLPAGAAILGGVALL